VVEGLKGTSGVSTPAPTNAAADAVTPIVRGVLAGLATPRRHADADSGADAARDGGSASRERREGFGMASPPSRRLSARARARAEAAAAEQTLARAEAVASAAAAASAAGRADMSTSSAPLRCSDSDSDDAAEREVTSRSVPVEETVIATVIDGTDETRNADDAEDRVSETDDLTRGDGRGRVHGGCVSNGGRGRRRRPNGRARRRLFGGNVFCADGDAG
jgi:hypothetical protein